MHVVITGASSGIGRALAHAFDGPGRRLSLVARRGDVLEEVAAQLSCEASPVVADLSDREAGTQWLVACEAAHGPVDVLVNNAGVCYVEPAQGVSAERIERLLRVNLHAPVAAVDHVLPGMLERGAGTVVNLGSLASFSPAPWYAHYAASKGGLAQFSESLRLELAGTGVHVLTVYPGPIHTPMAARNHDQLEGDSSHLAPSGDPEALARRVVRAVERGAGRLFHPRIYGLAFWFPAIAHTIAATAMPRATGRVTPPMWGDR
jgi:short-subunit dehydrogenase